MAWQILIAHAAGEEEFAELLAAPLRQVGYDVVHRGTVMVGQSVIQEASKLLEAGSPVVLCGTVKALGTGWAHRIVNAARQHPSVRVFAVQMEEDAYVQQLSFDDSVAMYWCDPEKATQDLVASLQRYYPVGDTLLPSAQSTDAEQRYRELALESCDIIDLANLPESDRHIATRKLELRRLYVPLRVRVEVPSGSEIDDARIEALTRARSARFWSTWKSMKSALRSIKRVPVGDRLGKARRLVVLGDPGAGKSTLVRWIATAYLLRLKRAPEWKDLPDVATLPEGDWLPILIRCRDLDAAAIAGNLDDVLRHTFRKSEMTEADADTLRSALRDKLARNRALLLIDGLDEISESSARARFCRQVEQIHVAFPEAPIIVTSRIVGYREMNFRIGRGFEHLIVTDLSPEDKDDFAHRWSALTETPERRASATAELIRDIHSTERIELLTGNPMLLTTLALVKRKVGKLPRRRADLYWEAVQVLLNWRSEVDEPLDPHEALPQLEYLAHEMCQRGAQQLREDEVVGSFERMRQDYPQVHAAHARGVTEFLHLLERRTGILVEAGHVRYLGITSPAFEFRHLTFQEYLAALALVHGRFPGRDRTRSLASEVGPLASAAGTSAELWREVLRLCVACCRDDEVDDLLRAILGTSKSPRRRMRVILATSCLADEPNASEDVGQFVLREFVGEVAVTNLRLAYGDIRELSASRWSESLYTILFDEFSKSTGRSRNWLADLYGALLSCSVPRGAQETPDWIVLQANRVCSREKRGAIEAALTVMHLAIRAKVSVLPELVDGLIGMLLVGPAASYVAARTLFHLYDNSHKASQWRPTAVEMDRMASVVSEGSADKAAICYLITIQGLEGYRAGVPCLIERLNDSDAAVRAAAAEALGRMRAREAVRSLLARLEDLGGVRRAAVKALGQIEDDRALDPLIGALRDEDYDVRILAASALGKMSPSRAADALLEAFPASGGKLRVAIIEGLAGLKESRAVEQLITALHGGRRVRKAAVVALGEIGAPQAAEPIRLMVQQERKAGVRSVAEKALARIERAEGSSH
jgi:hypothetical protein